MSQKSRRKQVGEYILHSTIGYGAFSQVYKGYNINTNKKVAIKSINLHRINVNPKHQTNLKQEIDILRKCKHNNIVQLLHTYQTQNHIYLIMQYCEGGDLHKYTQKYGKLNEKLAQKFSIQLASGLMYLHKQKIIHRDLKPQNILLSSKNINIAILQIGDFGFARHFNNNNNNNAMIDTMCGSPLYMAPEILKFNKYDSKVDLWSAGTIIYQMLCNEPPFNGHNHIELLNRIQTSKYIKYPKNIQISNKCKDLLSKLLKVNPQKRISWNDFFNHPWLKNVNINNNNSNNNSNNSKDYIIVDSKLNNNNNPNNFVKLQETNDMYTQLSQQKSYAINIFKVGDIQVSYDKIGFSLLLYLRGLNILTNIIKKVNMWLNTYIYYMKNNSNNNNINNNDNNNNNNNNITNNNKARNLMKTIQLYQPKYKELLLKCIEINEEYLRRGEAVTKLCESEQIKFDLNVNNNINIERIIFNYAINTIKKNCSQYLFENNDPNQDIESSLKKCNELLHYLLKLNTITNIDKNILNKYIDFLHKIIKIIEQQKNNKT